MKEVLKAIRDELKKHYVPLVRDERNSARNYSGTGEGCCIIGAIDRCTSDFSIASEVHDILDRTAERMFPELEGASTLRSESKPAKELGVTNFRREYGGTDNFNYDPIIYVNNHCGKDAILSVVRRAIRNTK